MNIIPNVTLWEFYWCGCVAVYAYNGMIWMWASNNMRPNIFMMGFSSLLWPIVIPLFMILYPFKDRILNGRSRAKR